MAGAFFLVEYSLFVAAGLTIVPPYLTGVVQSTKIFVETVKE